MKKKPLNQSRCEIPSMLFTLIELLVVIAIISILSALLLPALSKAKDMARTSICRSNLKQLSFGMHSYLENYNGWFPSYDTFAPNPHLWYQFIDYEARGDNRSLGSNSLANAGSPELWRCLSNPNHGWRYEALSYGYNTNLGYYDNSGVPFGSGVTANLRRLTHPSSLIVLGDGDGDMEYDTIVNAVYYVLGSRHNRGAVVSYADGHIDWILQRDSFRTGVAWDGVHWNGGSWDAKSYLMWGAYGYHSK